MTQKKQKTLQTISIVIFIVFIMISTIIVQITTCLAVILFGNYCIAPITS